MRHTKVGKNMKKFTVFSIISWMFVMATPNAFADCNSAVTLSYEGTQKPHHDEFLYMSEEEYNKSVAGYKNTGGTSGAGVGFECDEVNSHSCTINQVVSMPAGHVFEGEVINQPRRYQCGTSSLLGDDVWFVVDDNSCHTNGFGEIAVGDCVKGTNGACRELTSTECSGYEMTNPTATRFHGRCEAGPTFKCVAIDNGPTPTPIPGTDCENTGGTWGGTACVCDYNRGLTPASKTACKCIKPNATYNKTQKRCIEKTVTPAPQPVNPVTPVQPVTPGPNPVPTAPYNCDAMELVFVRTALTQWATNAQIVALANEIITYCNGTDRTAAEFTNKMAQLRALIAAAQQSAATARIQVSVTRINGSVDALNTIKNNFDISRWKNEEGKFNTARLASDSIAGVVLGTAGGLITSNVIKKNQVNNGFEDIQCTIGGQVVAGWDDQFTVGVR